MHSFTMKNGNVTVLGQETEFYGDLKFTDNLVITGKFEGKIDATGNLKIDKTGTCKVDKISADSILIAGVVTGALVDVLWLMFMSHTGIYEIIPGFGASFIAAVVVTLMDKAPSKEIEEIFDKAVAADFNE